MIDQAKPLLTVSELHKYFGAVRASDAVSFEVYPGEVHAIIGPNGAGKTTLIAQLSGFLNPDSGQMWFDGFDLNELAAHRRAHIGLVRSFQITSLFPEYSVLDNVCLALQSLSGGNYRFFQPATADRQERENATTFLDKAGLGAVLDRPARTLAYGQQRQLEIAMALALSPKLMLLDEPMAGMGRSESQAIINLLDKLKGSVAMLLVEHDMDAVFALADRVSVLVYGKLIATGTPDVIRADPEVQRAYLGSSSKASGKEETDA